MASYYDQHARQLKRDLAAEVPTEALRELHQKRPLLHAVVAVANFAALALAGIAIVHFQHWYFWLPCAVIAGFAVFDFTVLLHEVVHRAVLIKPASAAIASSACCTPCRAASRPRSSRAGISTITPASARPRRTPSGTTSRPGSTPAGSSSSISLPPSSPSTSVRRSARRTGTSPSCSAASQWSAWARSSFSSASWPRSPSLADGGSHSSCTWFRCSSSSPWRLLSTASANTTTSTRPTRRSGPR